MLMFAFGSNLNIDQMMERCPNAEPVCRLYLPNAVLRFRGVADIAYRSKGRCPGGLWEITEECEDALDRYEGVDHGFYNKRYLTLDVKGKTRKCLYYQMRRRTGIMPPSEGYYQCIAEGYDDFGLNHKQLENALKHSWEKKYRTEILSRRYIARGKPKLARIVEDASEQIQIR